jgi:hypothetical protein
MASWCGGKKKQEKKKKNKMIWLKLMKWAMTDEN